MTDVTFADSVVIADTELTRQLGFAGERGRCFGFTTPSVTGVDVIGELSEDFALNVHFESRNESFWFVAALVLHVDHGAGTEITLNGVERKWIQRDDGGWDEHSTASSERP